jgi:hypothetical protein
MASRQRRRRVGGEYEIGKKEETSEENVKEKDVKVMYMEEVDYKMEISDPSETKNLILINKDNVS